MNNHWPSTEQMYYYAWLLFAASIPLSKFSTTLFFLLTGVFWLIHQVKTKGQRLIAVRSAAFWFAIALFSIFLIGLWNTQDFNYAFKDLNSKTPLFFLPIWAFTGPQINIQQYRKMLYFLVLGGLTSAFLGYLNYHLLVDASEANFRDLSPFISHIRLALVLCIAVAYMYHELTTGNRIYRWLLLIPIICCFYYLNQLQSLTALLVLCSLALFTFFRQTSWKQHPWLQGFAFFVFLGALSFVGFKAYQIQKLVFHEEQPPKHPELHTSNGNLYVFYLNDSTTENGHLVNWYICDEELDREWPKRSLLTLDSIVNGFPLRATLHRYMSSRGFRKDSMGLSRMSDDDIVAVEQGIPNWYYLEHGGLDERIYRSMWEINNMFKGANPSHTSLSRRIFLWRLATNVIKAHFWLGVGTGDVLKAMEEQHQNSPLAGYRIWRPHNQFLTVLVSGGLLALIALLFLLSYYWQTVRKLDYLTGAGFIVIIVSFLWEDTLENQAGCALFAILVLVPQIFRPANRAISKGENVENQR